MSETKRNNFCLAVARLQEAAEQYRQDLTDELWRDGLIQRFEFTFELAWKSLREYMEDVGFVPEAPFPKPILREAYSSHLISHEELWLAMLDARNSTSHLYDSRTAQRIAQRILQDFLPELLSLVPLYQQSL